MLSEGLPAGGPLDPPEHARSTNSKILPLPLRGEHLGGGSMAWLSEAWRFIESKENQKTLTFIGGGIAAAVVAAWALYKHFTRPGSTEKPLHSYGQQGWCGSRWRPPHHPERAGHPHRRRCARYFIGSVSKGLGGIGGRQRRAREFLQDPGEAEGRARGPRQHPARDRQAL